MLKKLSLLSNRQKLTLILIFLILFLVPLTLLAIKKSTEYRGRAEEGEDPRTLLPATVYIPFFPVGKAEKVDPNELETNWRDTLEIFNLSGVENKVSVQYFDQLGERTAEVPLNLSPHASLSLSGPPLPEKCLTQVCVYSAIVESTTSVAVLSNLVREAANQYSVTSYKGVNSQEVSPVSHFPAILRDTGFNQQDKLETELVFFNQNGEEVGINVDIYDSNGPWNIPAASISAALKPKTSFRLNTKDLSFPFPFKGSAVVNQTRPLASVAIIYSDKRLYSYTPASTSNSLFIPAVNNKILYYPFGFRNIAVVQSHGPRRQEVSLKFFEDPSTSSETKFEVDPNLSYFLDLTGRIKDDKEVGVTLTAQYPISALVIKETPTYWGDVVLAKPLVDEDSLYFPFIANTGSDVPTETYITIFNPQSGPLNFTFASFDPLGSPIRKRTDDPPVTIWSSGTKTLSTSHYLYNPEGRGFLQGSLSVYSELQGKGFRAVVEGVRRINDSRALLAGDAFFSYDGQPLYAAQIPTPTLTPIPTPEVLCPPECESGLARRMGNAVCDNLIDDKDFDVWLKQYLVYQKGEKLVPEEREADFCCDPNNPFSQMVDLSDFEFWRRNANFGVIVFPTVEVLTPTPTSEATPTPMPTPTPTPSAFFSLNPSSGGHRTGEVFQAFLNIDTGGREVIGADAYLLFDPQILEVTEITPGNFFPENFKKIDEGRIYAGGAVSGPAEVRNGSGILAKITFKGKSEGNATVNFDCASGVTTDSNITAADPRGSDILDCSKIVNGTYTITD